MHIYGISKNGTEEPICRAGLEKKHVEWTCEHSRGKKRVGRTERSALKYTHYRV